MKKRLVIVDDHVSIRDMLIWILKRESDYDVIGQGSSGLDAMRLCGALLPDLLILDLILPCISGVEVLRRVRRETPATRVLIYSGSCNGPMMQEALRERPNGYVEKLDGLCTLRNAISAVTSGGTYYCDSARKVIRENGWTQRENCSLSPRETEILQMVAEGRSSKEISAMLSLALKTVENHRANIMAKLQIHDVAGLTRYAARRGMVAI